ncbi:DUF429 domain-containing protein [Wukongibacter baidiensis]|uniref:DUF429 domain-containing protein n=1 Tax=Wukongibacter baidiensis TaxID=1723361 RepID=UPI003D7F9271
MNFIGIDVHLNSFTIACIDSELNIKNIEDMTETRLFEYIKEADPKVIGIDAPYDLNKGYMDDPDYRSKLDPKLKGHYNKKVGEYELSRRRISLYNTPKSLDDVTGWKSWMKVGMELYRKLGVIGYEHLNESNIKDFKRGTIEVFPHGCFITLIGHIPTKKTTDEGLEERINLLKSVGFRDLTGIIGSKQVKSDKLDSIIAAYAALTTYKGQSTFLGDIREGQIVVPITNLKDKYNYGEKI